MGWTTYNASYYKDNGQIDRKAECDAYFMKSNAGYYEVVKSVMVGSVYYAAVKKLKKAQRDESGKLICVPIPEKEQRVFAAIFLTSVDMKSYYYNFGYKDMDESEGPYESNCPASILKLLSPTTSKYAIAWRERCWENINKKKEGNTLSALPIGTVISSERIIGEPIILIKCPPSYQFKKPFWKIEDENKYCTRNQISPNFKVLYMGTGAIESNWREKITAQLR